MSTIAFPPSFKPVEKQLPKGMPSSFKPVSKENEKVNEDVGRIAGQVSLGLANITPAGIASNLWQAFGTGEALAELDELQERLPDLQKKFPGMGIPDTIDRKKYLEAVKAASESVPTPSNLGRIAERATGLPFTPKTELDSKIRFISEIAGFKGGSIPDKILSGLKGEIASDLLQHSGVPEPVADALGLYYGLREVTPKVNVSKEAPAEVAKVATESVERPSRPIAISEVERLPSGLTKPRAIDSEHIGLAKISPEKQAAAISRLDKEAASLAQSSIKKHLPISEEIKAGVDFEHEFEKNFGQLKSLMEKANPQIDITPISKFFRETAAEYKGIPSPHPEAVKIKNEIRKFSNQPQTSGRNLLRIYRSNNKKLNSIFETSRISGRQQEYADFLVNMNKNISKSFERTLPEDSIWLKDFLSNNQRYAQYQSAKKALSTLDPLLTGELTASKVNQLAKDPKVHKRLELSLGKEGAAEVVQIAKDLKKATEAIKSIPRAQLSKFDEAYTIGLLIPGLNIPSGIIKGTKIAQKAYGQYLASPSKRRALDESLKALTNEDLKAYKTATQKLNESSH